MSTFVLANNVISFRTWAVDNEQAAVCTVNWLCSGIAGTGGTLTQAAVAFDAAIAAAWKGVMNSGAEYRGVQAYLNVIPLPAFATGNANAGAGTLTGNAMARQATGLLRWTTLNAGPAFRGRLYLPFPSVGIDDPGGVPANTYIAAGNVVGADMLGFTTFGSGGNTSTGYCVLLHRKNKAGVVPAPTQIVLGACQPKWATQKRRGSYGRPNSSPI